jgi:hypothetical protein
LNFIRDTIPNQKADSGHVPEIPVMSPEFLSGFDALFYFVRGLLYNIRNHVEESFIGTGANNLIEEAERC